MTKFVNPRRFRQHARRVRSPIRRSRESCRAACWPIALPLTMTPETERPSDFIRYIIAEDLRIGKYKHIITRFPPEPNGYLHIGHSKSICTNLGIAHDF